MSWHRNAKHHPPKWNLPTGLDRMGWHNYYAARWCRTQAPQALHLAMWYLILHHAFGSESSVRSNGMKLRVNINRLLRNDPVHSPRGAPMGAASYLGAPEIPCYVQRVRMVDGDYSADGTYWGGGGDPLWCGFHPVAPNKVWARASNRTAAVAEMRRQFPEMQVLRK